MNATRIEACLLGGALGDALGERIEFQDADTIVGRYPLGVPFPPNPAPITDDTQMTLFTAEGITRALRGAGTMTEEVHAALLRWYATQGGRPHVPVTLDGIAQDKRLWYRRAPGMTCMGALGAVKALGQPAENDSKGCGTIMRVAPVAFLRAHEILDTSITTSALTHGHHTGQDAAAAWAIILRELLVGTALEEAAQRALPGPFTQETREAIRNALHAPRDGSVETVHSLGGGWVAEEALAIALYACLCSEDIATALRIAVTHSGDSDTTGAIAGNALGILYPEAVLDHPWAHQVECRDLIQAVSRDLAEALANRA